MSDYWYIRVRGQVSGPFDRSQIESLVRRQRLGRHDEVSSDKIGWLRAAEFPDFFATIVTKKVRKSSESDFSSVIPAAETYAPVADSEYFELRTEMSSEDGGQWYFAVDGRQSDPVSFEELQRMLIDGRVLPSDPVWCEGMAEWVPAQQLPEFTFRMPPQQYSQTGGQRTSGIAVASLVLGILGLTLLFGIASIPAIVFGHLALGQIKHEPDRYVGRGQALAGLIMGYVGLTLMLILVAVLLITSQTAAGP